MSKNLVIAALILAVAGLALSQNTDVGKKVPSLVSPSIQQISSNGADYHHENVSVSGVVQRTKLDTFEKQIVGGTGNSVYIHCDEYRELDYGRKYKISGKVERIVDSQTRVVDTLETKEVEKKVTYIECSQPPQALN